VLDRVGATPGWPRRLRNPVVVGGGTPFLPPVSEAIALDLIETRTFGPRVVYERYGRSVAPTEAPMNAST
jgi:hypothetical protein